MAAKIGSSSHVSRTKLPAKAPSAARIGPSSGLPPVTRRSTPLSVSVMAKDMTPPARSAEAA
jgi:hypothetical protein